MKSKRTKKKIAKPLPKKIRDELILSCVLKCYSTLSIGKSKRLKDQYKTMITFYHERPPNHPSQIKLLCDASYIYRRLFSTSTSIATQKTDTTSSVSFITLKTEFTQDKNRIYNSAIDLNSLDAEKKLKINPQLIYGRQLHETAKRGINSIKRHPRSQLKHGI